MNLVKSMHRDNTECTDNIADSLTAIPKSEGESAIKVQLQTSKKKFPTKLKIVSDVLI